jgi:hypothetical protein
LGLGIVWVGPVATVSVGTWLRYKA